MISLEFDELVLCSSCHRPHRETGAAKLQHRDEIGKVDALIGDTVLSFQHGLSSQGSATASTQCLVATPTDTSAAYRVAFFRSRQTYQRSSVPNIELSLAFGVFGRFARTEPIRNSWVEVHWNAEGESSGTLLLFSPALSTIGIGGRPAYRADIEGQRTGNQSSEPIIDK